MSKNSKSSPQLTHQLIKAISRVFATINRPLHFMEVCGTHTVSIFRYGIRNVLPPELKLLSGPGCPVCVTSIADIDTALALSFKSNVALATYGDMMRVPGSRDSLESARAKGSDIRVIYSPLECLQIAEAEPHKEVVFLAVGFETTAPMTSALLHEVLKKKTKNLSILSVHKTVPPAIEALLQSPETKIDAFILPGHVCTITGSKPYDFVPKKYGKPAVVTGFSAEDILSAILMILRQISASEAHLEIQYRSVVTENGNQKAKDMVSQFFELSDSYWRGIGNIARSGLKLKSEYSDLNALNRFDCKPDSLPEPAGCQCGQILKGILSPPECKLFGKACSPEHPIGACMVSTEGSCSAFYKYSL